MSSYSDFANAISRIELEKGNALAQAQANKGQIWAGALSNLGNLALQVPQMLELRDARVAQKAADEAIKNLPRNPDGTFNTDALMQRMTQTGQIHATQVLEYGKKFEDWNQLIRSANERKLEHRADVADFALRTHASGKPWETGEVSLILAGAKDLGLASDDEIDRFYQAMQQGQDPGKVFEAIRAQSKKYAPKDQEPFTLGEGQTRFGPGGQPIATNPKAPESYTLSPGQQRIGANGQPIASVPYSLSPDQIADNERADKQLGISQGQLGVSQGQLSLARQREAREAKQGAAAGGAKLSATAIEKIAGIDQSLQVSDSLEKIVQDKWLGPGAGRAAQVQLKFPGAKVSDDLARFAAQTATLKNSIIKAITGAQMSQGEAERIMQQIPDFTDKPNVWRQKLQATRENLTTLKNRTLELSGGVAPVASHSVAPPDARWNPSTGKLER